MKCLLIIVLLLFSINIFAQINNTFPDDGNVGIGTTSPEAKLHVYTGNYGIRSQFGIGLFEAFDCHLDILSSSDATWGSSINLIEGNGSTNTDIWSIVRQTTNGSGNSSLRFNYGTLNNHSNPNILTLNTNGNIGIGATSPSEKLVVDGKILAEEIQVQTVPASDYIFEPDYDLRSLAEVDQFIRENKHLPDIPSAEEFKENGVGLGEMDDMLLRKVEELTLYMIDMQKQMDELKEENAALKEQITH